MNLEEFLKDFPITKGNKSNPYIILFDAYIGQGKSYVSRLISKYDNSIILNNDEVRSWLNNPDDESELYRLQLYRLNELLKAGNSCILDSCSCIRWNEKKEYLDKLGYKYYVIRLICKDNTVKERLSKRVNDLNNYSNATYDDYSKMKMNIKSIDDDLIDYVIDTEKNVEEEIKKFLIKNNLI